jgi:D-alanine-D-alanine ligase
MNKKNITLGFAYDLEEAYIRKKDDPQDVSAEFDCQETLDMLSHNFQKSGFEVINIGGYFDIIKNIDFIKKNVDIVFNFTEGLNGRNREAQTPVLLQSFNIPFIGSDGLTMSLTLDKYMTKKIFIANDIPTPKFASIENAKDLIKAEILKYPLFVKPRWEGSSKGINQNSKVQNPKELLEQAKFIWKFYKQPALIEEFIPGREFTVPIIGDKNPQVLSIMEVQIEGQKFGEKFYTGNFVYEEGTNYIPDPDISPFLRKKITDSTINIYKSVQCLDFGRIDFRVDEQENIYALEINPIPALAKSDAFGVVSRYLKMDFSILLGKIVSFALQRYGLQ